MANIIFDWDGTIAKPDVAQEASERRFKTLGLNVDQEWLRHALKTNDHYAVNKRLISEYTGIIDDDELTTIMTDIFRYHYTAVIHERKNKALYPGMMQIIEKLSKIHSLVIASTLRQDLIDYSLKNLDMNKYFKKNFANTPDLKYSKQDLVKMAAKHFGKADFMVGNKEEDLLAGNLVGAKSIYVTWGATNADHKDKADFVANAPEELLNIIK
jgi:phosphoglycolate phosphatase-like HAD superfamily hydrolase